MGHSADKYTRECIDILSDYTIFCRKKQTLFANKIIATRARMIAETSLSDAIARGDEKNRSRKNPAARMSGTSKSGIKRQNTVPNIKVWARAGNAESARVKCGRNARKKRIVSGLDMAIATPRPKIRQPLSAIGRNVSARA